MRYNIQGMDHPELSTSISSPRPLGSRDGTETPQGLGTCRGLQSRHQTPGQDEGKGVATCPANACTKSQRLDAKLMILTFGRRCTVHQQAADDLHVSGINVTSVKDTLRAIHLHSVECAVNIITQRRIMDRQKLLHSTDRPPLAINPNPALT